MLSAVDRLVLLEVYPAGENPIRGADGRALSRAIRSRGRVDPVFVENIDSLQQVLVDVVSDGDNLVTLGAGSIGAFAQQLVNPAQGAVR